MDGWQELDDRTLFAALGDAGAPEEERTWLVDNRHHPDDVDDLINARLGAT